jgi:endonuclease YncB( thermonuclease family)
MSKKPPKPIVGNIMTPVKIFWDPEGLAVDSLGSKTFLQTSDGDTPYISMSIRMLSIDTPEVHYPENKKPSTQDKPFSDLAQWIKDKKAPINTELGEYLIPKLATGKAGTLQEEQGKKATTYFEKILEEKLKLPNGTKRNIFLHAANEHFDQYGRLLAYMAPNYTTKEKRSMTRKERATFNLLMIEAGWAASFPIYPSIPNIADLILLQQAAQDATENKKGIWDNPTTLTGYEFRMCVKLHEITKKIVDGKELSSTERNSWIERYCVDMTTKEIFFPQDYYKVEPYNRIFIWPKDVTDAVAKMNLVPQETT